MFKKAIKILFLIFVVAAVGFAFWQISQNNPRSILKSLDKQELSGNSKKFVFSVKLFGIIPAGEAVLSEGAVDKINGRQVYCINAEAYPSAFISRFYKVKASVASFMDKESRLPVLFKQNIEIQNKPSDNKEVYYDQKKNIMTIRGEERSILPQTYDPLSAISFIRRQDFNKFTKFDINVNTNQKNYGMKGSVLRKEKIVLNNKEYSVWVLKANIARRDKNSPYHKSEVTLYLLDDAQKTPLLIKVFASGGLIISPLKNVE